METRTHEIADGIHRLSTFLPKVGGPAGLTFNQFLIEADEPLLFHTGQRALFESVSAAAARIVPLERLRWITCSHGEADESGALNDWLAAAPNATPLHGRLGCNLWLADAAARPPKAMADGEVLDLGGRRVRWLDTANVPHELAAGMLYEETTGTLFCSDLFTHAGDPAPVTRDDLMAPTLAMLEVFPYMPLTPQTGPTLRRLAALRPRTLAVMHGAAFAGDAAPMLERLAGHFEDALRQAVAGAAAPA